MKKYIKFTIYVSFVAVILLVGKSANASFVYTRTPSGNGNIASPITVRVQGVFGLDFCDSSDSGYRIAFLNYRNGSEDSSITLDHTSEEAVDDTFQVSLAPDTYRWARIFCSPSSYFFVEGNPQGTVNIFTIVGAPVIVTGSPLSNGSVGNFYSTTLEAASSVGPYTWSKIGGDLPDGLSVNSTGIISGTPTTTGTFNFTVQVQDSVSQVVSKSFNLSIFPASTTGFIYTRTPLGSGNIASPITVRVQGVFGLDFCNSTSTEYFLSFLNTRNGSEDHSASFVHSQGDIVDDTFQVSLVSDTYRWNRIFCVGRNNVGGFFESYFFVEGNPQGTVNIFTITNPPSIVTDSLPSTIVGAHYARTLLANTGTPPYIWSVVSGSLPVGLSLSSTGEISGTPTTAGNSSFTVQVTDASSQTATKGLSIAVNPAPSTVFLTHSSSVAIDNSTAVGEICDIDTTNSNLLVR